ncbi:MAG: AmmeMemoRadiSam system protein A [Deltaproteobacteria bacterium]|jgi:AmmeMemoRadiSam system protein A|nr:AmmeMemoRadiSam system protein A [Deltaproteobacteria bacterium]
MALENSELSEETRKSVLDWCFSVLKAKLEKKKVPEGPALEGNGTVFVTLKRNGKLRGCIGNFSWDRPLKDMIRDMTVSAAFGDPRFPPLSLPELEGLEITISVLSPLEPLNDLNDLVIGRDGLYIIHPGGRGVLLPVVAEEQGWDAREFAEHTSIKAGLNPQAYKDKNARLMVFTAPAFSSADYE